MSTQERVQQLVAYVEQGKILEAMDEFYAANVSMRENGGEPTMGLEANIEREKAFVAAVAEIHENAAREVIVDGDNAAIHWVLEFTNTSGVRLRLDQLALQAWQDGKIVSERFFYDSASVAV